MGYGSFIFITTCEAGLDSEQPPVLGVAPTTNRERTMHARRSKQTNDAVCGGHDVWLFDRIGGQVKLRQAPDLP
jgi:hypothetical protein